MTDQQNTLDHVTVHLDDLPSLLFEYAAETRVWFDDIDPDDAETEVSRCAKEVYDCVVDNAYNSGGPAKAGRVIVPEETVRAALREQAEALGYPELAQAWK